jgi:hypothetical protein
MAIAGRAVRCYRRTLSDQSGQALVGSQYPQRVPIGVGLARNDGTRPIAGARPAFLAYVSEVDLPVEDDAFPYLRLVDPYDYTVFSSYQCAVMEPEFERLADQRPESQLREVLGLVRACASDVSTALWFLGD